jgi:hypothetical protein
MNKIDNCIQKPAKGVKGYLLYTFNNETVFRVYGEDHSFTDYDIHHCDLELTINDDDATFYEFEDGRSILDHSYSIADDKLYNALAGEDNHADKGYKLGTEEKYNEFVKLRNKI